jgi:hypothetical protein
MWLFDALARTFALQRRRRRPTKQTPTRAGCKAIGLRVEIIVVHRNDTYIGMGRSMWLSAGA